MSIRTWSWTVLDSMTMNLPIRTRILIAEDDPTFNQALASSLSQVEREIIVARDGREAVDLLHTHAPVEIIVTELSLPEIDGFGILKEALAITPHALIILMTGYGDIENAVVALEGGVFDFKTKPLLIQEIEFAVRRGEIHLQLNKELERVKRQRDEDNETIRRLREELQTLKEKTDFDGNPHSRACIPFYLPGRLNPTEASSSYRHWSSEAGGKEDLIILENLMGQGVITESQYQRLKKKLIHAEDIFS